jgi:hypothetical protein
MLQRLMDLRIDRPPITINMRFSNYIEERSQMAAKKTKRKKNTKSLKKAKDLVATKPMVGLRLKPW